jgi:LysM domain.
MSFIVVRVENGDTAETIAAKYNTSVRLIFLHNNPLFFEGERLIIEIVNGRCYTAMPFDTLDSIAKKHNVTAEALSELNGVKRVFLGQQIFIPEVEK